MRSRIMAILFLCVLLAPSFAVPAISAQEDAPDLPWLTLDGVDANIVVPVGASVLLGHSDGAVVARFEAADCSGDPSDNWQDLTGIRVSLDHPSSLYWMARWVDDPDVTSRCCTANWIPEHGPADPPAMTFNGVSADISEPVGTSILLGHPQRAEVARFNVADCSGDPVDDWNSGLNGVSVSADSPATTYWAVRWIDNPDVMSRCYVTTWYETHDPGDPTVPVQQVKVNVVMPENASAEGALWILHAPETSQQAQAPFAQGVVGADNTFLLPELVPGSYRLQIDIAGYEPVDIVIVIAEDTTEITVNVNAIEEPVPTSPPIDTPPSMPTPPPTQESAVTELPSSGSGDGISTTIMMSLLAFAVTLIGALVLRIRRAH